MRANSSKENHQPFEIQTDRQIDRLVEVSIKRKREKDAW